MGRDLRELLTFTCEGSACAASLDPAPGSLGILIVSGGREVRAGAHGWQARLAAALAEAGYPVLRFDRRGVGDSEGADGGFASSAPDIAAAAAALRSACPRVTPIIGLGNCDGATALALFGRAAGLEAMLLLNPWTGDPDDEADGLPAPAAIRSRYAERLRDPASWRRLLTGGIDLRALARGLGKLSRRAPAPPLAASLKQALAVEGSAHVILAERDPTAIAFRDAVQPRADGLTVLPVRSHTFADEGDGALLAQACVQAIARLGGSVQAATGSATP